MLAEVLIRRNRAMLRSWIRRSLHLIARNAQIAKAVRKVVCSGRRVCRRRRRPRRTSRLQILLMRRLLRILELFAGRKRSARAMRTSCAHLICLILPIID